MKMKRGTDHNWEIRRYKGDTAWYAHCKCGYQYACSQRKRNNDGTLSFENEIGWLGNYCPNCGARKKWYNEIPIKMEKWIYE